jgi:hypothetical protein
LSAAPGARGSGIDIYGPDIARARHNADKRGLANRAVFIEGQAAEHTSKADAVINCGAYQAFGAISDALKALRGLVNPGGRVLFGAEIWERTPTEQQLSAMWPGTTLSTCLYLPDVVDAAVGAGFRPLRIETATLQEWDEFESGLAAGTEEWLMANPDHPDAGQVREGSDLTCRSGYAGTVRLWDLPISPWQSHSDGLAVARRHAVDFGGGWWP